MHVKPMNRLVWSSIVSAVGLSLAACGGSGSSGSTFFIEQCSLGCSNGLGGEQVSCGILNTFQNQELSVLFSDAVDLSSVNDQTFEIVDVSTGSFPAGTFAIDSHNPNRVVFRPLLDFDSNGNAIFGMQANTSYQIRIAGQSQNDLPPYIQSTNGSLNQSRLLCTITTDQGITDPVPGPPTASVFVDVVNSPHQPADNATNVATSSTIQFEFNDLMDIGTLVIGGASPFISVAVDPDGDLSTTLDQTPLSGTFSYTLDQSALKTIVTFTTTNGMPSSGEPDPSNPNWKPRLIVVTLPGQIRDLAGNGITNPGQLHFEPELIQFQAVTLPDGTGEQFVDTHNCDVQRTGADWGIASNGRLLPGIGGGSGRLGDLAIKAGQTVTLHTSPVAATGTIACSANPKDGDFITIGASVLNPLQFVTGVPTGTPLVGGVGTAVENHIPYTSYSLAELVNFLNASADPDISQASYHLINGTTIEIVYKTEGAVGNTFAFTAVSSNPNQSVFTVSGTTLSNGSDLDVFTHGNLLDNFDFSGGGTPPDVTIGTDAFGNAIFDFASLRIDPSGRLVFVGDHSARVLVRGEAFVNGTIDVSGTSAATHPSNSPIGEDGASGGPGGGAGGNGGDRKDSTGSGLLTIANSGIIQNAGVKNPGAFIQGTPGVGVGGTGLAAAGPSGVQWPTLFPADVSVLNDLATDNTAGCVSDQVGGPGGGGGYATDGKPGVPLALVGTSSQGTSNMPANTAGGDSSVLGLEAPGAPPVKRKLTPKKGFLRGGSGGGGAGANLSQSKTNGAGAGDQCVGSGAKLTIYRDQSAAGGGGGGGGLQLQVGAFAQILGLIDLRGGDGGSAKPAGQQLNTTGSSPGGAGSGGALLLQSKHIDIPVTPPSFFIDVAGGFGGVDNTGSLGGDGSMGLLRFEGTDAFGNPLDMLNLAQSVNPYDALNDPSSLLFATAGSWAVERTYPDSLSGAQSCWIKPTGVQYFDIQFQPDGASLGWDMDLLFKSGANTVTISYRTPTAIAPFNGLSPEAYWGTNIKPDLPVGQTAAPLAVRFQGVRTSKPINDLCHVDITDPTGGIVQSTLTPWVTEPVLLNLAKPTPEMVRFAIVFDASHTDFTKIVGIKNFRIIGKPN